jgi:O-antigen/teichoic acid export membrane protein
MAGALIQIFIAFPGTILIVLGVAVLWALLSWAAWGLLLVFVCGASITAVVAGSKCLKNTLRMRPKSMCGDLHDSR